MSSRPTVDSTARSTRKARRKAGFSHAALESPAHRPSRPRVRHAACVVVPPVPALAVVDPGRCRLWRQGCEGAGDHRHPASAQAAAAADPAAAPMLVALKKQLDGYRRIIVLLADEEQQSAADRGTSTRVGQQLFHDGWNSARRSPRSSTPCCAAPARSASPPSAPCWTTSSRRRNCSTPTAWPSAKYCVICMSGSAPIPRCRR